MKVSIFRFLVLVKGKMTTCECEEQVKEILIFAKCEIKYITKICIEY